MNLPTYFKASGTGLLSTRSDWTADATQVIFQCGATLMDHEDRSQGEFLIFRNEWLAAQAKLFTRSGLNQETPDHNCISVDGANQIYGQLGAAIIADENRPSYSYVLANVAPAYGGTLKSYTREVLFLKPNYVIVRDLPVATNPQSKVVWNLQTLAMPLTSSMSSFVVAMPKTGLFGLSSGPNFTFVSVKKTPDQDKPTYRITLPPDSSGNFLVAMETALNSQAGSTLASQKSGLPGFVCGNTFVGWAYGPITYTSPVSGPHVIVGLKPSTPYYVGSAATPALTTSPSGILAWNSLAPAGSAITISETPVVVPPPSVTVMTGKKYTYLMVNGTLTLSEVTS